MADASGSASWLYDSRGRLVKETKTISGQSFVTEWGYNSADLPTWMKYPDGEIVTNTYDNSMLLKSVDGNDTYVFYTQYDSAGRMTSRELGNGITQAYEYYPWNQQGGRLKTLAAETLQNMTYIYDSVGNISSISDSVNSLTQSFGYDALDRLTSASASGTPAQGAYSETYQYDPVTGNLKIKGDMTLDYLDSSHVHAVTNANSNTYSYDSNGNQTTRNIGSDTFNLYYDAENRLVEVKKNGATIAQFTFDGDGKRVKSVVNGETILFVGSHFELEGSQATKYYFAGASRIAIRKYTVPQSMTVEYMLGDHLGSTSITTDNLGAMISEIRYKAWGETRYTWTNAPVTTPTYELTRYQYTGQYSYDAEFGLKFYNARFYDSGIGRFVSADTVVPGGAQGYDRYAYANNSPVVYNDPSGAFEK
ncbi:MAG: tRNA nuclease WapA [Anaerolineales bacterium]|nr:tRNA nuclease WapA [Anaerolineales bacterium]